MKNRVLPTAIVALVGAVIGSFLVMLYVGSHMSNGSLNANALPAVSAAPLGGGSDQERITSAVKRALPSVVALNVTINGVDQVPVDAFGQFYQNQPFQARASGSGFVISSSGLIATNAHVVIGPDGRPVKSVQVVFANGEKVNGTVYAANPTVDVALVKVSYNKLPAALPLADSSRLELGQWAIAIGEPLQLQQTVTLGVVSGFNRSEVAGEPGQQPRRFSGLLQTSAPINPGNSGGPLVDISGNVIGINQLTAAQAQNIGFAIPINLAKQAISQLEQHPGQANVGGKEVSYIGVYYQPIDNNIRQQLGGYVGGGIVVAQVVPNGPAAKAGIEPGTVIQSVDGKRLATPNDFKSIIATHKPGDRLQLRIWFQGDSRTVAVPLGSIDTNQLNVAPTGP
ncbi:MAG: trypsin-like peptidase domain-containing protein [Candidatus Eremiobacteraeota bacterium]|nr:trypsin-like peptidase domain-containing protein [Candidatus Eremiobacteraeota bacterium]